MKRILVIGLLLALVLTLVMPTAALAARPAAQQTAFSATAIMQSIDTGNVRPLGKTGNWLVMNRHIQGQFVAGDMGLADYTITYNGIFDLATQAGDLIGTLQTNGKYLLINGSVAPLTFVEYGPYELPVLSISGNWTGLWGLRASGTFQAYMVFIPTTDGHVAQIVDSAFIMNGNLNGRR